MTDSSDDYVDETVFVGSSSIFAKKRDILDEDALIDLARNVLKHAAQIVPASKANDYVAPSDELDAFCQHLLNRNPRIAMDFIRRQRAKGLTSRDVLLGYVSASARRLGEMWEADEVTFVDVTVATGYLYGLIRASSHNQPRTAQRKYAVFSTLPNERHSLGVTVAAELFREAGWEIDVFTGLSQDELVSRIADNRPQILGLSLSRKEQIPTLSSVCVSIRLYVPETLIIVAGRGVGSVPDLRKLVDVDDVFSDADEAQAKLARLMWLRGRT